MWVVGAKNSDFYTSDTLISLPVFPTTEDKLSKYIGVIQSGDTYVYPEPAKKFSFSFSSEGFSDIREQDLYIIHNLWGYNFNFSIISNQFTKTYINSQNMNLKEPNVIDPKFYDKLFLPKKLMHHDRYQFRCPVSTLFTKEIEPFCNNSKGYLAEIKNKFQVIELGGIDFSLFGDDITLYFQYLEAYPYNFIDTPQMFLSSWRKSNSIALYIAGIVFTVISIVSLIIFIIILVLEIC